jgi:hypothetical protein
VSYDNYDWHAGGDFPVDLGSECGGTHIGMFLAWAISRDLIGDLHREEFPELVLAVRQRQLTGREFLFRACDGKFWDEDLNDEGNAFAKWYYAPESGGYGRYISDYERAIGEGLPTIYHVEDSWENYDRLAPIIDERFGAWKRGELST